MNLEDWQRRLREFSEERDWVQFHTPKNLATALSVEAAELLEIFQWLTPEESELIMSGGKAPAVLDEVADVLIYLLRLADVLDLDLEAAVAAKVERNEQRFPVTSSTLEQRLDGGVRFADLLTTDIPSDPGVYIVRHLGADNPPVFVEQSGAGRFKGKDPTFPVAELVARWVTNTDIVYIGKAGGGDAGATLRSRLRQYASFGQGRPVGHWGGRSIFQIPGWENLRVSWIVSEDAPALESQLIQDFVARHGRRPFANLKN